MTVQVVYTVDSLEGLAMIFDQRANRCKEQASRATVKKHQAAYLAECSAWATAAQIVRETKIEPPQDKTT
jgi:hypothetical protein